MTMERFRTRETRRVAAPDDAEWESREYVALPVAGGGGTRAFIARGVPPPRYL